MTQKKKAKTPEELRRYRKDYNLKKRYGVSLEQFEQILSAQGNICPICERNADSVVMCLDHNHKTLKLRGVPCLNCNLRVLGGARDQDYKLINAARYVQNNPADIVFPDGFYLEKNPPKKRRKRRVTTKRIR